eukprot:scaffold238680_cov33-Tisochrysis_lutea.AAC.1
MRADTTSIRRAHRDSTAKDIGATTLQSMNHQIERAGRRALLRIDLLQAQWARAVPLQPFSKTIVVLCMATWKAPGGWEGAGDDRVMPHEPWGMRSADIH